MRKIWIGMASLLAMTGMFALTGAAHAAIINDGSNLDNLQAELDKITTDPLGDSSIDVYNDEISPDEVWTNVAGGGTIATLIVEIAGYAAFDGWIPEGIRPRKILRDLG